MITSLTQPVPLSDGNVIPGLGYGTFRMTPGEAAFYTKQAIDNGYRHIDCAWAYYNEEGVGQAIRECGVPRRELFLTCKVPTQYHGYHNVIWCLEDSLKRLRTEYADLLLVHWPLVSWITEPEAQKEDILDTWRAFEDLKKAGKVRSIGLSNFEKEHVELLLSEASEKPVLDQLQINPQCRQKPLTDFLKSKDIRIEGWASITRKKAFGEEILTDLAAKYGKSPAQICMRYVLQEGVLPLAKARSLDHLRQNMDLFDFELTPEEQERVATLEQKLGRFSTDGYTPRGPQTPQFGSY